MRTKTIDTLVEAQVSEEFLVDDGHMVQFEYLDTLHFLAQARMNEFLATGDFSHYVRASKIKTQINNIHNRKK